MCSKFFVCVASLLTQCKVDVGLDVDANTDVKYEQGFILRLLAVTDSGSESLFRPTSCHF